MGESTAPGMASNALGPVSIQGLQYEAKGERAKTKLWSRSEAHLGGRARDRAGDPCSCMFAGAGAGSSAMSHNGVLGHQQGDRGSWGDSGCWKGIKTVND